MLAGQSLEPGLSLDDEHAVEVRFVVKFKSADEVQVKCPIGFRNEASIGTNVMQDTARS